MIKKVIAIILVIIVLLNFILLITGKIEKVLFWSILLISGTITHFFYKIKK